MWGSSTLPLTPSSDPAGCARATYGSITARRLYSARRHLFGRRRLVARRFEHLWPFANARSAMGTLSSLDRSSLDRRTGRPASLAAFVAGLAAYHRSHAAALRASGPVGFESSVTPPLGGGGEVFFDDNAWIGLALVRHYETDDDERALSLAGRIFDFVTSGWSSDTSWSHPGGVRWKQPASNVSRHACSNAPSAELAALLSEHGGDPATREWSVAIYDWVRDALLGPDGLYADRIAPDGMVSTTAWSYNQGTMIGAGVLLHRVTGDGRYLTQATETAAASLQRFNLEALLTQDAAFNAVFFRNLFLLDEVVPDPRYRQLALDYGEEMWRARRHPGTGLFRGQGSPLNNTAPLVELYALLAGAAPHA